MKERSVGEAPRTIRELAELAGVSTATVSRVLNGSPHVSAGARAQIEGLIERYQFRPDPAPRALANRRWSDSRRGETTIAVLLAKGHDRVDVVDPMEDAAEEMGYRLERIHVSPGASSSAVTRILRSRGILGAIVSAMGPEAVPQILPAEEFIVINCGTGVPGYSGYHTVGMDMHSAVLDAIGRARMAGYKKIGMTVIRPASSMMEQQIASAAYLAREVLPGGEDLQLISATFENQSAVMDAVLSSKVDVLIGRHDGFYWALREAGIRIPEDLGFISLQRSSRDRSDHISGFAPILGIQAELSVKLMHRLIQRHELGRPTTIVSYLAQPKWKEGLSLVEPPR